MGDSYKKVKPGESISGRLSAGAWNSMLDVVEAFGRSRHDGGSSARPGFRDGATVKLRNDSGQAVARFAVLGLGEPIFPPDDEAGVESFTNCPAFAGVTPEEDVHEGRFAIALEPADTGEILLAAIAGVCPVLVNITDATHACADIDSGSTTRLASAEQGAAQIVWPFDLEDEETGEQWALIRFGGIGGPCVFYGTLDADASAAGWCSVTPCDVSGLPTGGDAYDVWIGSGTAAWYGSIPAGTVVPHARDASGAFVALGTAKNVCQRIGWEDDILKYWPITDWGMFATVNEDDGIELVGLAPACVESSQ